MQRCGRCRAVYYCSRECQTADWGGGGHRELCKTAAACSNRVLLLFKGQEVLLAAKTLRLMDEKMIV